MEDLILATDGSAAPRNPGNMRTGFICCNLDAAPAEIKFLGSIEHGHGTNNRAEYLAVMDGLNVLQHTGGPLNHVTILCDSQLLVRQLTGVYQVKDQILRRYFREIKDTVANLSFPIEFSWHARESGLAVVADALSKGKSYLDVTTLFETKFNT